MAQHLQPYLLPALAAAGAIFLTKKFLDINHNRHTVLDGYDHREFTVPEAFTNYFKSARGLVLHTTRYLVPAAQCRGMVFFCHGFTEHSLRYEGLAYEFNKIGYSVCLIDHAGHGASQGDRSFCGEFMDYINDAIQWMNFERDNMTNGKAAWGVPGFTLDQAKLDQIASNVVIMGHSMGGLIATRVGMHLNENPSAIPWLKAKPRIILSAPGLALDKKLTDVPFLLSISKILSTYFPKMIVQTMPDVELSSDPRISTLAFRDPLFNGPHVYARFGAEFISTIQFCQDKASELFDCPLLVMQSDNDNIIDADGPKNFFKNAKTGEDQKEYLSCRGFHEILFDQDRELLLKGIAAFIGKHQKD